MQNYKIVIFGAGNVAHHLGKALKDSGYNIIQIIGRTKKTTIELSQKLDCNYSVNYKNLSDNADIYIIATSDISIPDVLANVNFKNKVVLHTSGSTAIDIFGNLPNHGVLYPLQTFSKNRNINFDEVPLFIEANNEKTTQIIKEFAKQLSQKVEYANSEKRMHLHLAAVFACNFTNHMLSLSQELLEKQELDFDYLNPLVVETINKAIEQSPIKSQTGPAIRNDITIIKKHIELLSNNNDYQKLYSFVSKSIYKLHGRKKRTS